APIELAPTKAEFQSNSYTPSYDLFMWYAPMNPPVSIGGLYGEYLNKRLVVRAAKQKDSGEFHPGLRGRQKGREATLIDRVLDLEGLCESLLTLSKEVKRLRGLMRHLDEIHMTWGSFGEETDKNMDLHQHLSRNSTQRLETASQFTRDSVTNPTMTGSQDFTTVSDRTTSPISIIFYS
ncbi:hypothetical protein Tco_0119238, partial [Tanacetum coccineum]